MMKSSSPPPQPAPARASRRRKTVHCPACNRSFKSRMRLVRHAFECASASTATPAGESQPHSQPPDSPSSPNAREGKDEGEANGEADQPESGSGKEKRSGKPRLGLASFKPPWPPASIKPVPPLTFTPLPLPYPAEPPPLMALTLVDVVGLAVKQAGVSGENRPSDGTKAFEQAKGQAKEQAKEQDSDLSRTSSDRAGASDFRRSRRENRSQKGPSPSEAADPSEAAEHKSGDEKGSSSGGGFADDGRKGGEQTQ